MMLDHLFYVHVGTTAYKDLELQRLSKHGFKVLIIDDLGIRPKDSECYLAYRFEKSHNSRRIADLIKEFSKESGLELAHLFTMADGSVDTLNSVCRELGKPLVYSTDIESIRDKYAMRRRMEPLGYRVPVLEKVTNEKEIPKISSNQFPVIVKPIDSLDSRGVSKVQCEAELLAACNKVFNSITLLPSDRGGVFVEETYGMKPHAVVESFIDGYEFSVEVIVVDGVVRNRFVTFKRNSGPPFFYEHGHTSGLQPLTVGQLQSLNRLIGDLIRANGYVSTVLHIEFRAVSDDDIFLIECNSRLCGDQISDLIEQSYGVNVLGAFFKYVAGIQTDCFPSSPRQITSRFYLTSEKEGALRIKRNIVAGIPINWWKVDKTEVVHLSTAGATRLGAIEFHSGNLDELSTIENAFLAEWRGCFEVVASPAESITDFLTRKIKRIYFWALALLSFLLIVSTGFIQWRESESVLVTLGRNVSGALLSDVVEGEILPIAQKLRALGFLDVTSKVSVTDRDFLSLYSADNRGRPTFLVYQAVDRSKFEFQIPIESDGIVQGYLMFNRNLLRFWTPLALMGGVIIFTLVALYFVITRKIVPGALRASADGIRQISSLVFSLNGELTKVARPDLKHDFELLERINSDLSKIPAKFSEVSDLREVASEILTTLRQVSAEIGEKARLSARFEKLNQRVVKERERQKVVDEISRQVAHDIRSPLAALKTASQAIKALPEGDRILITAAVGRISDIANDLLAPRVAADALIGGSGKAEPVLLSSMLEVLLSEKRMQFRTKPNLTISSSFCPSPDALFAFVLANSSDLRRAISNIINNAVEALGSGGVVAACVSTTKDTVTLTVTDTGRGISSDLLGKIGTEGFSVGKAGGSGLGVYQAKAFVKSVGGRFAIQSEAGCGTAVEFEFPRTVMPVWFPTELKIASGTTIVVLDDSEAIHNVWKRRFVNLVSTGDVKLIHFYHAEELSNWPELDQSIASRKVRFLIDYELGVSVNGISVARDLHIENFTVLVTGLSEEGKIVKECEQFGILLLPKTLAPDVPIVLDGVRVSCEGLRTEVFPLVTEKRSDGTEL